MRPKPKKRIKALAALMEIEVDFLEQCVEHEAIDLENLPEGPAEFSPSLLAKLRRLQRICGSLGLDVFAGCIVVDLIEQMEDMQHDLERLRALVFPAPAHKPQDVEK